MCSKEDFGSHALLRGEAIGRHQFYAGARKNLLAAVPAFFQHHAAEGQVVIDGRDQAASTRFTGRRHSPGAVHRIVKEIQLVGFSIEEVARR